MKTIKRNPLSLILMGGVLALSTSSATLFSGKTTPAVLIDAPSGLKVSHKSGNLSIERVLAHGTAGHESTTQYFAKGVMLDKKNKVHNLTLEADGKKGNAEVKLRASGKFFVLNLFTSGVIGIGIDAMTHKWRIAGNKYIDVPAVLNGSESRSQRQLKKYMKKSAK